MNSNERQQLKAAAHPLKPVVIIGANGLSESVLEEIDISLKAHELIKVKIHGMEKEDRRACAEQICSPLACELVQHIGNTLVLYRKNPGE